MGRRAAAGLAAAAVGASWLALPPATAPAAGPPAPAHLRLALHVHTTRSDGTGSREEVARAAARAGVAVVVLTDHGDGRRAADPPAYLDGVLVIDGVEISTWSGHYVAVGAAPAPYPLGGEPRAVVEDVARLGGFGIAAHPGSAKPALRWRDWDAPLDGLEWLNGDSVWRDAPRRLWRALLAYPWRGVEAVTTLIDRPEFELTQWDRLAARRPAVGLVAHDAHARLGLRGGEPYDDGLALGMPSYRVVFGGFANVVMLPAPLTGEAADDATRVLATLRAGRSYAVLSGIAPAGALHFAAESGGARAEMGGWLAPRGPVVVRFAADVPAGAHSRLVCDGQTVADEPGGRIAWRSDGVPGACRVEVQVTWDGAERPWLVTNPIYLRAVLATPPPVTPPATVLGPLGSAGAAVWAIEHGTDATAQLAPSATADAVEVTWQLGPSAETFAAVQMPTAPLLASASGVRLRVASDGPRRVWVQLRVPDGGGQRWGSSIYVDGETREIDVPFAAMAPFGDALQARPPLDRVGALLVVTDTVHAAPGSRGRLTLWPPQLTR